MNTGSEVGVITFASCNHLMAFFWCALSMVPPSSLRPHSPPKQGCFYQVLPQDFRYFIQTPPAPVCIYSLVCSQNLAIFEPLPPWCGHHSSVASNNSVYVEGVERYHSTLALPTDTHAMQSQEHWERLTPSSSASVRMQVGRKRRRPHGTSAEFLPQTGDPGILYKRVFFDKPRLMNFSL